MTVSELLNTLLLIALLVVTTPLLALVCIYCIDLFGKPKLWL